MEELSVQSVVGVECLLPGDRVTHRDDRVHLLSDHKPDLGDRPEAVRLPDLELPTHPRRPMSTRLS